VTRVVQKYGGSSVATPIKLRRVARRIRESLVSGTEVVVVVSAMARVTDQLVAMGHKAASGDCDASIGLLQSLRERHLQAAIELLGAKKCAALLPKLEGLFSELESFLRGLAAVRELTPRGSDYLLSFGELLSSLIVADAFAVRGINAAWVDSRECLVTDAKHTHAVPQMPETRERSKKKISPLLSKKRIPVMGGFIAATADGGQRAHDPGRHVEERDANRPEAQIVERCREPVRGKRDRLAVR